MGWGVAFGVRADGRVFCADGCNWEASKDEYEAEGFWPIRPSVANYVLTYFEKDSHEELDRTRDCAPPAAACSAFGTRCK